MSILDRITKEEMKAYTHEGWLLACPVYVSLKTKYPTVVEKNWIPEFYLMLNIWASEALNVIGSWLSPHTYTPAYALRIRPLEKEEC